MVGFNLLVAVALAYVLFLFAIAFFADRRARRGRTGFLRSSLVYTLSLSIYCTAWTFYGAVGSAARNGLEFLAIYLGPTIVFVAWWWVLRKLVRIGRRYRVTSIADLISSRYGKSSVLAVLVTLLAVIGTTPYIALQLQSVTLSLEVFAPSSDRAFQMPQTNATAFWIACGLAVFTILFGTRNIDANERHDGVVIAIAVEAMVKLIALLVVGIFVVWAVAGGVGPMLAKIETSGIGHGNPFGGRWLALTFLSATAIIALPRMFQFAVVENVDERHLARASWAFPLYLFLISMSVLPIAATGLDVLPAGSNPDLFVLTVPLAFDQGTIATLAFLGGFSSATSMVIVAAIALSTMVSNHIVLPIWLSVQSRGATLSGDVRRILLSSRRISIAIILALGYAYFRFTGGSGTLASIGLISFAGVAQVLPALVGGIFWRGATLKGAIWGLCAGFALWAYALFLPSFGDSWIFSANALANGPFGIEWLRPQGLLGLSGLDPLVHALIWSLGVNLALFIGVSLITVPSPLERLQSREFVNVFQHAPGGIRRGAGRATSGDLMVMAQRILGARVARSLFQDEARAQGLPGDMPQPTPAFLERLECQMSGSVGGATAHAMVTQITGGAAISVEDLLAVADETAQIKTYSAELEEKSRQLAQTAEQLRLANERLLDMGQQRDEFLSQISHELRTPMTSIRSFSEILRDGGDLDDADLRRFSDVINTESIRLTRLLDDLLDLSVLENGQVTVNAGLQRVGDLLDRAVASALEPAQGGGIAIKRDPGAEILMLHTDGDRLAQVFINLITNARKYCDADTPELTIMVRKDGDMVEIDFADNGSGIPEADRRNLFEKFARFGASETAGGTGLGLAISREIMKILGGTVAYVNDNGTWVFRVRAGSLGGD